MALFRERVKSKGNLCVVGEGVINQRARGTVVFL